MSAIGIFLRLFESSISIAELASQGVDFCAAGIQSCTGCRDNGSMGWKGHRTSLTARVIEDGTLALNKSRKNVSISYSNICP